VLRGEVAVVAPSSNHRSRWLPSATYTTSGTQRAS
jgi:hypothetical protein